MVLWLDGGGEAVPLSGGGGGDIGGSCILPVAIGFTILLVFVMLTRSADGVTV